MSNNKLASTSIKVKVGDDTFQIVPFGFEMQLRLAAKFAAAFAQAGFQGGQAISFTDLVEHAADVVFDATAAAIGKPRSYLASLSDFEGGMKIAEAVYQVNAEVFVTKVLPSLKDRLEKLAETNPEGVSGLMKLFNR